MLNKVRKLSDDDCVDIQNNISKTETQKLWCILEAVINDCKMSTEQEQTIKMIMAELRYREKELHEFRGRNYDLMEVENWLLKKRIEEYEKQKYW